MVSYFAHIRLPFVKGDCDSDDDCLGDLKCYQRDSADPGVVPGCTGEPSGSNDYCYDGTSQVSNPNQNDPSQFFFHCTFAITLNTISLVCFIIAISKSYQETYNVSYHSTNNQFPFKGKLCPRNALVCFYSFIVLKKYSPLEFHSFHRNPHLQ